MFLLFFSFLWIPKNLTENFWQCMKYELSSLCFSLFIVLAIPATSPDCLDTNVEQDTAKVSRHLASYTKDFPLFHDGTIVITFGHFP